MFYSWKRRLLTRPTIQPERCWSLSVPRADLLSSPLPAPSPGADPYEGTTVPAPSTCNAIRRHRWSKSRPRSGDLDEESSSSASSLRFLHDCLSALGHGHRRCGQACLRLGPGEGRVSGLTGLVLANGGFWEEDRCVCFRFQGVYIDASVVAQSCVTCWAG